ncbi:hypothetical protein ABPG75_013462 [Micractinium tetrahymenae]
MARVDIRQYYRHFPIDPADWPLLAFRWQFEGKAEPTTLWDPYLQFGQRKAPEVVHRFTLAILAMLRSRGVTRAVGTMYDFLIVAETKEVCYAAWQALIQLRRELGFSVNMKPGKTEPPAQRRQHISVDEDRYCLVILVPKSKTNPFRERRDHIYVAGGRGSPLDPVAAYKRMLQLSPTPPSAPAFGWMRNGQFVAVSHAFFVRSTKQYAAAIGMDPSQVSGHSYRRGGATFAFTAGAPDQLIQQQGIWASLCYRVYIDLPLEALLLTSQLMLARIARM